MRDDLLQQARALVERDVDAVEQLMAEALTSRAETITKVSRHLLASGGKRVRALICLLTGHATGFPISVARRLACCAELIHAASLCHDDVLDSGELRRGQPTVRALFGNAMSILLGDYCLAQAFRLMAENNLGEAGSAAARAVTAMAEGEVIQAACPLEHDDAIDRYFSVAEAKTGALLVWCASLGNLVAEPHLGGLKNYGRLLGRVYQIADDILDYDADEQSGKRAGQDLYGGKSTLPLLLACKSRPELAERVQNLSARTTLGAEEVASLTAAIRSTGALDEARERARSEARNAAASLRVLPISDYRTMLAELARFAAERHA